MLSELKIAAIQIILSLMVFALWVALWKSSDMDDTMFLILVHSVLYVSIMFWLIRTRTER